MSPIRSTSVVSMLGRDLLMASGKQQKLYINIWAWEYCFQTVNISSKHGKWHSFMSKANSLFTSGLVCATCVYLNAGSSSVAAAGCCRRAICGRGERPLRNAFCIPGWYFLFSFVFCEGQITVFVAMLCGGFSGLS